MTLNDRHLAELHESGISDAVIAARSYESVPATPEGRGRLQDLGFKGQQLLDSLRPGYLLPLHDATGEVWGYQYKPDTPRRQPGRPSKGSRPEARKRIKYETPVGQLQQIDVPPNVGQALREDPARPLLVTEGAKKADAAVSAGLLAVDVLGVGVFQTEHIMNLGCWESLALAGRPTYVVYDSDATTKPEVQRHEQNLAALLAYDFQARTAVCSLTPTTAGAKVGLDDFLVAGGDIEALMAAAAGAEAPGHGLPALDVTNNKVLLDWLRSNLGAGALAGIYLRGDEQRYLVVVPQIGESGYLPPRPGEDDGPAKLHAITPTDLRAILTERFRTYRVDGADGRQTDTVPSGTAFADAFSSAARGQIETLPRLAGVTHVPLVRRDGSLLDQPGFDADTGYMYLPDSDLDLPVVPSRPTKEQVTRARRLLVRTFKDFPFVTQHDRANYLGALLTPLLRIVCPPPWPAFLINAPMPGSGKSLLAQSARLLHGGVLRNGLPHHDDEMRKTITTILVETTAPVVQFDNVREVPASGHLESLFTESRWSDRWLGQNRNVDAPNDRLWTFTGNNIAIGGDQSRRTFWTTIDPKTARPWERTDFATPDLVGYLTANRGKLLAALLTMARYRTAHRRSLPARADIRSDQYGLWASSVHAILRDSGVAGSFLHESTNRGAVGTDDAEWAMFLAVLADYFGADWFSPSEVLSACDSDVVRESLPLELLAKHRPDILSSAAFTKSLGLWLRNREGRYAGTLVVRSRQNRKRKALEWRVSS